MELPFNIALKKARIDLGVNIQQLSRIVLMHPRTIAGYEAGERDPALKVAIYLARMLRFKFDVTGTSTRIPKPRPVPFRAPEWAWAKQLAYLAGFFTVTVEKELAKYRQEHPECARFADVYLRYGNYHSYQWNRNNYPAKTWVYHTRTVWPFLMGLRWTANAIKPVRTKLPRALAPDEPPA